MRRTVGALVAVMIAWPVTAAAEVRPTLLADHPASRRGKSAAELELGWYTDTQSGATLHSLTPFIGYRYAPTDHVEFELDWPFVFVSVSPDVGDGDSGFYSGNPFLAAYYVGDVPGGYFRVGGGIAPPLANADAGSLASPELLAYSSALAMRGFWDMWLYMFDRLSLVIPAQIEADIDGLVVGGDFAFAHMIGTDDMITPEDETILQLAGMLGGRIDKTTLGARLQLMWLASSDVGQGDDAQLSLVPFVQADTSGFFYAKILLNLDEPLGILGDGGDVWGLFVGGGGRY